MWASGGIHCLWTLVTLKTFFYLEDGCSTIFARCGICFKGEVISTTEALADSLFWLAERRKRPRLSADGQSSDQGKP